MDRKINLNQQQLTALMEALVQQKLDAALDKQKADLLTEMGELVNPTQISTDEQFDVISNDIMLPEIHRCEIMYNLLKELKL